MKAASISRATAWAALAILVLGAQAALAEPLVYVPLGGEDRIVIVDTAKGEVVDAITDVKAVHGLAGTPDGQVLIAGSYQERGPGAKMPSKPSSISKEEHAAHHQAPPAAMQKADAMVSTVSVIRTEDRSIIRRIDVPGAVHHVAVSPDGRFAVVTHPNNGAISAIDLNSFEVTATVKTGSLPNYAAFSPRGDKVYVSNGGDDTVSVVETKSWNLAWNVAVGSSPEHVVLSDDGATLYVNNVEDGTVSVINIGERQLERSIPVGATPHGIDLSDDGGTLFVTALGDNKLVAVDLTTGTYRSAFLAPEPYHLAIVRGSAKIFVSSADEPKAWVVDAKDLSVLGEIPIGGKGHQMVMASGS